MKIRNQFLLILTLLLWQAPTVHGQWQRVAALPQADIYSLYVNGNTIYAGGDSIVYIGANNGATWTATNFVTTRAGGIEATIAVNNNLFVGTFARGIFFSNNNGQSWQPLNNGLTGLGALSISAFVEKSGKLYAATNGAGVFVLDLNNPVQWSSFSSNFPVDISGSVHALTLSGSTLVAGAGANGFIYLFREGATGWTEAPIIPPIAPGLAALDFATSGSQLFAATTNRVYRSANDGQSWSFAGNGLIVGTESVIAAAGQTLFVGINFSLNRLHLYRSQDLGQTWQLAGEFINGYLYDLEVSGANLYAARIDGLWFAPLTTVAVEDRAHQSAPQTFVLEQNHPNPFNPQTTISFVLPKAGAVTLKVYDALGREAATLVNRESRAAGAHRVTFEAKDLPSGLYFYRLEAAGFSAVKKMVLAR